MRISVGHRGLLKLRSVNAEAMTLRRLFIYFAGIWWRSVQSTCWNLWFRHRLTRTCQAVTLINCLDCSCICSGHSAICSFSCQWGKRLQNLCHRALIEISVSRRLRADVNALVWRIDRWKTHVDNDTWRGWRIDVISLKCRITTTSTRSIDRFERRHVRCKCIIYRLVLYRPRVGGWFVHRQHNI